MQYVLGVDLGTTYSAAAVGVDGRVEIFQLGIRQAAIPSVVAVRDDGTVLVGEPADRHGGDPSRLAREFKRRLGDTTPLLLGGAPYGAETLTARLLEWIVERVRAERGERESLVVVTHPAGYGRYKLSFLEEAARLAGVSPIQLLSEPVAAALDYAAAERVADGELLAVYDFGGGTLDVAILRKQTTGFEVIGTPGGMERFGGSDLDQAVFGHVLASLGDADLRSSDPSLAAALAALRDACREAKEALSFTTDVVIPVLLPGSHTEVRLTRAEFEEMLRPRLVDTVRVLERAVASADSTMGDLSRIVLVGGASRIPLVAETIFEATGRPVVVDANPKHAVALGAARFAMGQPQPEASEPGPAKPMLSAASASDDAAPPRAMAPPPGKGGDAQPPAPRVTSDRRRRGRLPGAILAVAALSVLMLGGFLALGPLGGTATPTPGSETSSLLPSASVGGGSPASPGNASAEGRVAALYALDYGLPKRDGGWYAWAAAPGAAPPEDLASDFFPRSGPYSSTDPAIVDLGLVQLDSAGVGVIAAVWDPEAKGPQDQALEVLMEAAERTGQRVLFWIDATGPAKLASVPAALERLLGTYAEHPAMYVSTEPTSWSNDTLPKPVVILGGIDVASAGEETVAEEWRQIVDDAHRRWRAVVLAGTTDITWLLPGHFDGLVGHASGSASSPEFGWADAMAPSAWYTPVVIPGRTSDRVGSGPQPIDRGGGETYRRQWAAALAPRHAIGLLLIDSYNGWGAGTQIEPARSDVADLPRSYQTYAPQGPDVYLELTRELVAGSPP